MAKSDCKSMGMGKPKKGKLAHGPKKGVRKSISSNNKKPKKY